MKSLTNEARFNKPYTNQKTVPITINNRPSVVLKTGTAVITDQYNLHNRFGKYLDLKDTDEE